MIKITVTTTPQNQTLTNGVIKIHTKHNLFIENEEDKKIVLNKILNSGTNYEDLLLKELEFEKPFSHYKNSKGEFLIMDKIKTIARIGDLYSFLFMLTAATPNNPFEI